MNKKIIFSAGGTGGHIFPAVNLMKHFLEKKYEAILVTDKRGSNFVNKSSKIKFYELRSETTTNKNFFNKILALLIIFNSIFKSISILKKEKADLIIGFGGYVSFPIAIVSKFFNVPLIIYEPNMVFGRANKYLLPFASKVFLAKKTEINFPEKYKNKIHVVGSILDKNIINNLIFEKKNNKKNFSILVLGGSQGAEIFGKIIPEVINMINKRGHKIEINQQCTSSQKYSIIEYYKKKNIKNYVFEFDNNILNLILSSDLAITRCGASTTAELIHLLTPFIAVPIPNSVYNHQYLNAKYYEEKGCCWIMNQKNFIKENLFNLLMEVISDKNKLEIMRDNMKKNCESNVYNIIEHKVKEII